VLLVVVVLAAVIYLVVRLIQGRGKLRRRPRHQRPEPRVNGPDDDPDFLRGLDRPDDDK